MRNEHADHLVCELERVILRFRREYDMSYATFIGVFVMVTLNLWMETLDNPPENPTNHEIPPQ
jgi:hypothetical protein